MLAKPAKLIDDQVQVARFMNLLNRYFGNDGYREQASHAMRYLASASAGDGASPARRAARRRRTRGRADPHDHRRTQGRRRARKPCMLWRVRCRPATNALEWLDLREGKLPNPDVEYPDLGEPAAFACSNRICSFPSFNAEELAGNGEADGEAEAVAGRRWTETAAKKISLCSATRIDAAPILIALKRQVSDIGRGGHPQTPPRNEILIRAGVRHGRDDRTREKQIFFRNCCNQIARYPVAGPGCAFPSPATSTSAQITAI